jgi:hypothetical protein
MLALALSRADALRGALLRGFGPWARPLFVRREVRAAWWGAALVSLALAATAIVPMWLLALGPIVWGVPHVVSDIRYLVVRPGDHRRLAVAAPMVLGLVASALGGGLRAAVSGALVAVLLSGAKASRRLAVAAALAAVLALAQFGPREAALAFAHGHNVVALAFFAAWPARGGGSRTPRLVPLGVVVVGGALVMGGALDGAIARAASIGSCHFDDLTRVLAPMDVVTRLPVANPERFAARLVLLFAFAQAAHYAVWVRLVPELARPSSTPRSFSQSYRALTRELGRVVVIGALLAAAGFAAWAAVDVAAARTRYLQIAFFHGYLEIAAAALFFARGRLGHEAARA